MSSNDRRVINGPFSGNVNSNNFVIGGDTTAWQRMMSDMMRGGSTDNAGPPRAPRQPAERRARTQPDVSIPTQWSDSGMDSVADSPRYFSGGPIFDEPRGGTQSSVPEGVRVSAATVREPPAWKLNYKIGNGSFGTVFLEKVQTRGMESPELWAVKRLSRTVPNFPAKQYQSEVKNLQMLSNHEWFVKFNSSYEDADYVYIAMEYIPIGDISKTFVHNYRWNESDTKVVIEQLLHGLVVMHKEGITHRDLKPENIFLCLPEGGGRVLRVKIGDFGTSKRIPHSSSSTYLRTTTGTQDYMAPEMDDTEKAKTNRVDIWALGCVLYRMFAGRPLFNTRFELYKYVMTASSPPSSVKSSGLSVTCVDFLSDVLKSRPEDRPSAEDCLKKPWIMSKAPGPEYSIGGDLYKRLLKIQNEAPNIDSFTEKVAARAAYSTPARSSMIGGTPTMDSTATTLAPG